MGRSSEIIPWNSDFGGYCESDVTCCVNVPYVVAPGYTCVYKRRTGTKTDGCATCYRSSRFSEVSVTPLEFFRPDTELLDRHNVGIVVLLRPAVTRGSEIKTMGPPLCVANTHLLFNPRRGDVKLTQLAVLLAEIDKVVKSCKARGEHCNLIMCGDFNSLPYTPLYQLITTGELYYQGLSAWMVRLKHCKDQLRKINTWIISSFYRCHNTIVSFTISKMKSELAERLILSNNLTPQCLKYICGVNHFSPTNITVGCYCWQILAYHKYVVCVYVVQMKFLVKFTISVHWCHFRQWSLFLKCNIPSSFIKYLIVAFEGSLQKESVYLPIYWYFYSLYGYQPQKLIICQALFVTAVCYHLYMDVMYGYAWSYHKSLAVVYLWIC